MACKMLKFSEVKGLRLVFTSDGVVVGVVSRRVERYDLVKIKPTESEAEAEEPTNRKVRNRTLLLVYSSASACDSDNAVFT